MGRNIWAPPLELSDFNVALAVLGGFVSLFGLVSFLLKERFYLSEALISLLVGVGVGPAGAGWLRPRDYAGCPGVGEGECGARLAALTLDFSRLVLGVQLVLAGVQLPSRYLRAEARALLLLVGPGMAAMWLATSGLVWAVARPAGGLLHALAVGACVTPTDPVLSAVIVKGKFADGNIPRDLQDLIVAESGTNDGLGYPFLFFALYLIKFTAAADGAGAGGGVADALGLWLVLTWAYTILLSLAYGALVGLLGKELLHWAERRGYVDRESFLVFAVALALFLVGTCGLLGTDDVLACFIAGNTFTWDDWFRLRTKDDSLQPTIDMLLNVAIFLWYGASLPWADFARNDVPRLDTGRLVLLGLLVLLLRRLPWVFAMHRWIHQIRQVRQAVFVGFFGPIGVSAVFYLFLSLRFIDDHLTGDDGVPRPDVEHLGDTIRVIVWFLVVCSIVVHGLSIPLGKLGYLAPRTFGLVRADSLSEEPLTGRSRTRSIFGRWLGRKSNGHGPALPAHLGRDGVPPGAWDVGSEASASCPAPDGILPPSSVGHGDVGPTTGTPPRREIRLPDESHVAGRL